MKHPAQPEDNEKEILSVNNNGNIMKIFGNKLVDRINERKFTNNVAAKTDYDQSVDDVMVTHSNVSQIQFFDKDLNTIQKDTEQEENQVSVYDFTPCNESEKNNETKDDLDEELKDLNETERIIRKWNKDSQDHVNFENCNRFIFWNAMGINPSKVRTTTVKLNNKYNWLHHLMFNWEDQQITLAVASTKDDKQKGYRNEERIFEFRDFIGDKLYWETPESHRDPMYYVQKENMIYLPSKGKDWEGKDMVVVSFDLKSKEGTYKRMKPSLKYRNGKESKLFEYKGKTILFYTGQLKVKSKDEKFAFELFYQADESYESFYHEETTKRNLNPHFKQIDENVYFYLIEGDPRKPVEEIILMKINILTKKVEIQKRHKFESKVFMVQDQGNSSKIIEFYELKNLDKIVFVDPIDKDAKVELEDSMIMFALDDQESGFNFRCLRRLSNPMKQMFLMRFKRCNKVDDDGDPDHKLNYFQYHHTTNQWVTSFVKQNKAQVHVLYNEREAKKYYKELEEYQAKVLMNYHTIHAKEGPDDLIEKCIKRTKQELKNDFIVLLKSDINYDEPQFYQTFAIRVREDRAFKFEQEGKEGFIQQYRRKDPYSVNLFENYNEINDYPYWAWYYGLRYHKIYKKGGKVVSQSFRKNVKGEWRKKRQTASRYWQTLNNEQNDGGHPCHASICEDFVNNRVRLVLPQDIKYDPYNEIKVFEYDKKYIEYDFQIETRGFLKDFQPPKQLKVNGDIEIFIDDQPSLKLKQLKLKYTDKNKDDLTLQTYMNCEQVILSKDESHNSNDNTDEIEITIFTPISYFGLIKNYKVIYRKNDKEKQFQPRFKFVSYKMIISGFDISEDNKFVLCSEKDHNGDLVTYLRDNDSGEQLPLKSYEEVNYKFDSNNFKSTYYYYLKRNCRRFLMIDIKFSNETQMNKINERLTDHEIDLILSNLTTALINMKPQKKLFDYWKSEEDLFQIDLYQHREDLNGLSYATVLSQQGKYFKEKNFDVEEIDEKQMSLIQEFASLTHRNIDELLNKQELAFIEPILIRKPKDVGLGLDLKSSAQHCLYRKIQYLSSTSQVIVQIIKQLKSANRPLNNLSISMLAPHIVNHPLGMVCDEAALLFFQYEQGEDTSSFFQEINNDIIPQYFQFNHSVLNVKNFDIINAGKIIDEQIDKTEYKSKDQQSSEKVKGLIDKDKPTNKFCRSFKMDKEFFNINIVLRENSDIKDQLLFSHEVPQTDFEQGLLLSQIIEQFGIHIDNLSNVRSMIDYRFEKYTRKFFITQQICFFFFSVVPFLVLIRLQKDSKWTIPLLVIAQISQIFFFLIELINLSVEGWRHYLGDKTNIADYSMFFLHTTWVGIKAKDYAEAQEDKNNVIFRADDSLNNTNLFLIILILFTFVAKTLHIIKVYKSYGRLTVLMTKTLYQVFPFMVIYIAWTILFAFSLFVLKSSRSEAVSYTGIPISIGYFWVSFENGIGNINPPTVDQWLHKKDSNAFLPKLIIYCIYIVWFFNQFILFITLLNFVIALVNDVFEMVMDSKMRHEYEQRKELNDESDRWDHFWWKIKNPNKSLADEQVAQVVLVCTEKKIVQDDDEWDGLMKTLKKFVGVSIIDRFRDLQNDIVQNQSEIREDVERLDKVQTLGIESLKREMKNLTDLCESLQKDSSRYQISELKKEMNDFKEKIDEFDVDDDKEDIEEEIINRIQNLKQKQN